MAVHRLVFLSFDFSIENGTNQIHFNQNVILERIRLKLYRFEGLFWVFINSGLTAELLTQTKPKQNQKTAVG